MQMDNFCYDFTKLVQQVSWERRCKRSITLYN
jgi:hypothetical protein